MTENGMMTYELLKVLKVKDDELRRAILRGHLKPQKLPNGMFWWTNEEIENAREFFARKKGDQSEDK